MPKKILLADDSITIQKVISLTLASEDYELIVTSDGVSAIEKIKETKPDLILADVAMPGKTGYEVCEFVKHDAELSRIPVMLLSGTFEVLDATRAEKARPDDHIVKPFESEELISKIKQLLSRPVKPVIKPVPLPKVEKEVAAPIPMEPKPPFSEDIWEAGDFLGSGEEEEEVFEEKGAPSAGAEFFEETKPAEKAPPAEEFFDLELTEEEPAAPKEPAPPRVIAPSPPPIAEKPAPPRVEEAAPLEPPKVEEKEVPFEFFEEEEIKIVEPSRPEPKIEVKPTVKFEPLSVMEAPFEIEKPAAKPVAAPAKIEPKVKEIFEEEAIMGAMSKEKIEEIVARVARSVIEEIAWEVVPDLAEEIIRKELLNKFKEAMGKPR